MKTKICSTCKECKELSEFGKNKLTKDGFHWLCKICARNRANEWRKENSEYVKQKERESRKRNRAARLASSKKYYELNKQKESNRALRNRYGITDDQISVMKKLEKCPICGIKAIHEYTGQGCKKGKIVIDHEHETGNIRGFVCSYCNTVLGMARDNISYLENVIQYLKNSKKENLYATN